jgi:hypothetical protein
MQGKKHTPRGIPVGEQGKNVTGKVPPRKVGKPTRPKKRARVNRK